MNSFDELQTMFRTRTSTDRNRGVRRGNALPGFTLIELLVVVAIIAMLISILVPVLAVAREEAKTVKCGAALQQIGLALSICQNEYGGYYPMWDDGERATVNHEIIATWMDALKQRNIIAMNAGYCPSDERPDFLNAQRGADWSFKYPPPQTSRGPIGGTDYSYAISIPLASGAHTAQLPYTYGTPAVTESMKQLFERNVDRRVLVMDGFWNWIHNMSSFGLRTNNFSTGAWYNNTAGFRHGMASTLRPAGNMLMQDCHVEKDRYNTADYLHGVDTIKHFVTYPGEPINVYPAVVPTGAIPFPEEIDPWAITGAALGGNNYGWVGEIRIQKGWDGPN